MRTRLLNPNLFFAIFRSVVPWWGAETMLKITRCVNRKCYLWNGKFTSRYIHTKWFKSVHVCVCRCWCVYIMVFAMNTCTPELIAERVKFSHKNDKYMNGCMSISDIRSVWKQQYKIRYKVAGFTQWFGTIASMWQSPTRPD